MFLSNIDQVLNFDVQTIHFFASHKDFPPQTVTEKLKCALSKVLVPYDFLAGRMKLNPKTGRLEIDCNGAGAGFVVGSSECTLEEIGDLVYPNPAFGQLVAKTMDSLAKDDNPLCIVQVSRGEILKIACQCYFIFLVTLPSVWEKTSPYFCSSIFLYFTCMISPIHNFQLILPLMSLLFTKHSEKNS